MVLHRRSKARKAKKQRRGETNLLTALDPNALWPCTITERPPNSQPAQSCTHPPPPPGLSAPWMGRGVGRDFSIPEGRGKKTKRPRLADIPVQRHPVPELRRGRGDAGVLRVGDRFPAPSLAKVIWQGSHPLCSVPDAGQRLRRGSRNTNEQAKAVLGLRVFTSQFSAKKKEFLIPAS